MSDTNLKVNQTFISGKIDAVGMFKNKHQTRVMLPASDAFSMPAVALISSKTRLGNVGDMLEKIHCNMSGIPNDYMSKDEQVHSAKMWLEQV